MNIYTQIAFYATLLILSSGITYIISRILKLNEVKFWQIISAIILATLTVLLSAFIIFKLDPGLGESPAAYIAIILSVGLSFYLFHIFLRKLVPTHTLNQSFVLYFIICFITIAIMVGLMFILTLFDPNKVQPYLNM